MEQMYPEHVMLHLEKPSACAAVGSLPLCPVARWSHHATLQGWGTSFLLHPVLCARLKPAGRIAGIWGKGRFPRLCSSLQWVLLLEGLQRAQGGLLQLVKPLEAGKHQKWANSMG